MDTQQNRELAKEAMQAKFAELNNNFVEFQDWLLDIFFSMPEESVKQKLLEYVTNKKAVLEGMVADVTNESTQQVADLNQSISDMQDLIDQLGDIENNDLS